MTTYRSALAAVTLSLCAAPAFAQASASGAAGPSAPALEIFGEGVFSTGRFELPPTFTPGGETAYFTVSTPAYGRLHVIMETHLKDGLWSAPEVASFSGQYGDADPLLSPDGSKLFFISRRPLGGEDGPRGDFDIFYVEREGEGWGEPVHVAAASGPESEYYASVAADGTLYIAAVRPDSNGDGDIYRVPLVDGEYMEPENLGPAINSPEHHDTTPFIAPDQSYLVFGSFNRPDGMGSSDVYISFRQADGSWSRAENLGPQINSASAEHCPTVSSDGYLYLTSDRGFSDVSLARPLAADEWARLLDAPGNGLGDTYRIELSRVLETLGEHP